MEKIICVNQCLVHLKDRIIIIPKKPCFISRTGTVFENVKLKLTDDICILSGDKIIVGCNSSFHDVPIYSLPAGAQVDPRHIKPGEPIAWKRFWTGRSIHDYIEPFTFYRVDALRTQLTLSAYSLTDER